MTALSEGAVLDLIEVILERAYDSGFRQVDAETVAWKCRDCGEVSSSPDRMFHEEGCVMEDITRLQYGPRDARDISVEAQVKRLTALLLPDLQAQLQQAQARAEALKLRAGLEKARDMFKRDAAARKQSHDEWVAEGDLFPQMSADAYAGWKAYAVAALVLDGILTPALAPAEAQ